MPDPSVSILIPSYNHARFLPACLDSVLGQSFQDWEVILVDDGSSDTSYEIAQSYALKDSRIKVFKNEQNLGTYGTEQRALELSYAEFVAVLNSDDFWDSSKLLKQVEALDRDPDAAFCYTLGWMTDDKGVVVNQDNVHADWPVSESQEILPWLLCENRILASSVLFRREGLQFHAECRYSGDWVALIEQSLVGHALCIPEHLTFWRQHDNNTYTRSAKQVSEEIWIRQAIAKARMRWNLGRFDASQTELIAEKLAMNALNLHALAVLTGQKQLMRQSINDAALLSSDRRISRRKLLSYLPLSLQRKRLFGTPQLALEPRNTPDFEFRWEELDRSNLSHLDKKS